MCHLDGMFRLKEPMKSRGVVAVTQCIAQNGALNGLQAMMGRQLRNLFKRGHHTGSNLGRIRS